MSEGLPIADRFRGGGLKMPWDLEK